MSNVIIIPRVVDRIGSFTFAGADNLKSVTIPKDVSHIAADAFSQCPALTTIYCEFGSNTIPGAPWGAPSTCKVLFNCFYEDKSCEDQGGGNVDLSFITAAAGDILAGKISVDSSGKKIAGNIPEVSATLNGNTFTVPAGHVPEKQTLTVAEMAEPSVSANVVTIGKGYNKAQKTVTIPEASAPTTSGNVVTVNKGYQAAQKKITVGTAKAATTITPGTKDQIITSGTFLTGAQTIKGDSNLLAENIAEGVSIFGVAGTHSGGSSMDFYKCAAVHGPEDVLCYEVSGCPDANYNGKYLPTEFETSGYEQTYIVYKHETNNVYYFYSDGYGEFGLGNDYEDGSFTYRGSVDSSWYDNDWMTVEGMSMTESTTTVDLDVPKTWDGYKAVFDGEYYSFEETLTTGLVWDEIKPAPLLCYTADVLVQIKSLYNDLPNPVFWAPVTAKKSQAETGQFLNGSAAEYTVIDGVPCCRVTGSKNMTFNDTGMPAADAPRTLSCWFRVDDTTTISHMALLGYGTSATKKCFVLTITSSFGVQLMGWSADLDTEENVWQKNKWHHIAATKNGAVEKIYLDGELLIEGTTQKSTAVGSTNGGIGCGGARSGFIGYLSDCRIYNVELTAEEITELANEFTPTA